MSESVKIKINVLNRQFPLMVKPEEEDIMREAARKLSEKAKEFKGNFAVRDDLDTALMCALHFAFQWIAEGQAKTHKASSGNQLNPGYSELDTLLDDLLKKYNSVLSGHKATAVL